MIQNTTTTHLTVTKYKNIFIPIFCLIIFAGGIFFVSKFNAPKNQSNFDKLFEVSEIPRFDIKTKENIDYKNRGYTKADFKLGDKDFSGKIKTRGNSTFYVAEKYNAPFPYRIKLEEKEDLLELGSAKTFILLPNFIDTSGVRQFYHLNLANYVLNKWSPKAKYIELYINDKYSGLYLLSEAIGKSESRISYKNDLGFIAEMDIQGKIGTKTEPYVGDEDFAIDYKIESDVPFKNGYTNEKNINVTFELNDPDSFSETSEEHKKYIVDTITDLHKNAEKNLSLEELKIDIDSFVDYFMLEETFGNYGIGIGSVYYWNDGEKTYAGPFWDSDRLATNYNTVGFIDDGNSTKNMLYRNLLKNPEYKKRIKKSFLDFYENTAPKLKAFLESMKNNETFKKAWEKNENLYHRLSRTDIDEDFLGNKNIESRKTLEEQIDYIIGFYFDGFDGEKFWEDGNEKTHFEARLTWIKNHIEEW